MGSRLVGQDRGYPIIEHTLYIYCDACGSFNIKTYIPFIRLAIMAGILAAGGYAIAQNVQLLKCLLPLSLGALALPWKDMLLKYKCRQCGNTRISSSNTKNYPAGERSVVDVPEDRAQKRYMDEDGMSGWKGG